MSDAARGPEIHVTMPDGSVWAVDGRRVAKLYALHRQSLGGEYGWENADILASDERLVDWAVGNLNWADVSDTARLVSLGDVDFSQGWQSGAKKVVRPKRKAVRAGL